MSICTTVYISKVPRFYFVFLFDNQDHSQFFSARRTPFQIRFITDGFEGDMEAKITAGAEKGFQLMYTQFADNC